MRIQDRLNKLKNKRGFTLVELMIVVAIIGVLSALAIYGVRKYLTNAKSAEARMALGRMAKDAQTAYEREKLSQAVVTLGTSAAASRSLCPSAAHTVPAAAASIANKKYQAAPAEWKDGAGWECLQFTMTDPQYFMYNYTAVGTGAVGATFAATANGDLDGDTNLSTFTFAGKLQQDPTTKDLILTVADQIKEVEPEE